MLKGDRALTYAARPDDPPFQRRTWKRANPSLDTMPDLEARLREEAKVARRDPVALASFEALRLNKGVSDTVEQHLLQPGTWAAAEGKAAAVGGYVLGIDMGSTEAMSAACGYFPETGSLRAVACYGDDPNPKTRGLRDGCGSLYAKMHSRGELVLSPGRGLRREDATRRSVVTVGEAESHRHRQVEGRRVKESAAPTRLPGRDARTARHGLPRRERRREGFQGGFPARPGDTGAELVAFVGHRQCSHRVRSGRESQVGKRLPRRQTFQKSGRCSGSGNSCRRLGLAEVPTGSITI